MAEPVTLPRAPENVRLVHPDGTVIPLELVHAGWEGKDAVWENSFPVATPPSGTRIKAKLKPAHTVIRLVTV